MAQGSGPADDGVMTSTRNKQIVEEFITALRKIWTEDHDYVEENSAYSS